MHTFVLGHTRLTALPFLQNGNDGLRLHLADEVIPVWEQSELEAPPFWAFAWAGGQALARYVLDNPELVRGKRVLDLASGSGLVAIAAARSGADVTATEIDDLAAEAIAMNAAANDVSINVQLADILDRTVEVDVILAGDVFYSREMSGRVLSFLDRAQTELVLVGDPGRAYAPESGFQKVAEYTVPVNRDVEDADHKRTVVLRATYET
jgi:predicted nicotinamide N-methyase